MCQAGGRKSRVNKSELFFFFFFRRISFVVLIDLLHFLSRQWSMGHLLLLGFSSGNIFFLFFFFSLFFVGCH